MSNQDTGETPRAQGGQGVGGAGLLPTVDLRAENAYYGIPLPRLSFAEIFPEEFRGYSA
jgi:hypothetical protein